MGLLGAPGTHKKPQVYENPFLPGGTAMYEPPGSLRRRAKQVGITRDQIEIGRKGGLVHTSGPVPDIVAKVSGYADSDALGKALKKHEVIHSIQASKRGYRTHTKIRDLIKDEVGAYAQMNRGQAGGSKILRTATAIQGAGISTAIGIANNPRLRVRAGKYAGAAAAGATIAGIMSKKKETNLSAREVLEGIIQLKAVDLGTTGPSYYPGDCKSASAKKYYPSLYVSDREDDLNLPMTGTAKVKFRMRSKTVRQDENGKTRHSADIEILTIDPDTAEPTTKVIKGAATPIKLSSGDYSQLIELGVRDFIKGRHALASTAAQIGAKEAVIRRATEAAAKHGPAVAARGAAGGIKAYVKTLVTGIPRQEAHIADTVAAGLGDAAKKIKRPGIDFRRDGVGIGAAAAGVGIGIGASRKKETRLSARDQLNSIIELTSDPRPRNRLGMFANPGEDGPNQEAIHVTYKSAGQALAGGALAGVGATASSSALKSLMGKLKKSAPAV